MGTVYWIGKATAVAQVGTVQITSNDVATTYKLTVGDQVVSTLGQAAGVNDTATALAAAWNASTHVYFTGVTASAATDTVTLTADTAGVPFVATSSVTGGAGTIGAYSATTASAGPNDWSSADNWSGGAVPVANDDVILRDSSTNICWGLDQSAVELDSLTIEKSYTGQLGVRYDVFATSANGETTSSADVEYRATMLEIDTPILTIREHRGPGTAAGSGRILINLGTVACEAMIESTASQPADSGRPAVQLDITSASTNVYVRGAPGGVGIGTERPTTTSTVGKVSVTADNTAHKALLGDGVTITTFEQSGGSNTLRAAATVTTVTQEGGTLQVEGEFTITTCTMEGGIAYLNNAPAAGSAITTLNLNGGTVHGETSSKARTWGTVNMGTNNATLIGNDDVLTITTLNEPDGPYTLTSNR